MEELIKKITQFRDERDWKQFHSPKNLATAITFLWTISCIKLVSWAVLEVTADLGWWRPTAKILRDLIDLGIITAITLVIAQRDYNILICNLAYNSYICHPKICNDEHI